MSITRKPRLHKSWAIEEAHDCNILLDSREIFLGRHSSSDEHDSDTDFKTAWQFVKNLRILERSGLDPIIIHHFNRGGDWSYGMMIYDAIKNAESHIIIIGYGEICSMGAVITQAADSRYLMPNSLFMVHYGDSGTGGTYKQEQSWNEISKNLRNNMINIFAEKCIDGPYFQKIKSVTVNKVKKFIQGKLDKAEDWILFPQDAVLYGFVDHVFESNDELSLNTITEA